MGSVSIDISLSNLYKSWYLFRRGKQPSRSIDTFQYYLERNLKKLHEDIRAGTYTHGAYQTFTVYDNKRRKISVASVRDRVVHRLLYEYLVPIYDKTFIYDAWSCRRGKGTLGAIERAQKFLRAEPNGYVWRGDIARFFDTVDQNALRDTLRFRITNTKALHLLDEVIGSYRNQERERESYMGATLACP